MGRPGWRWELSGEMVALKPLGAKSADSHSTNGCHHSPTASLRGALSTLIRPSEAT